MSMSWRITCFGPFQVSDGTQVVTEFPSVPAKLLLASLALHPGELVPREVLCERLWPEAERERQRARFRWTLSRLRKALSPELFVSSGNSAVGLAPGTTSDVAEFDAHIRASFRPSLEKETLQELRDRAEGLQREAFLVGHTGEWVESERERRAQQLAELRNRVVGELEKTSPAASSARASDSFFGRMREQQLLSSFARSERRLLTVTGTGGLGKTRLVREALLSEALLFVPMAALTDAHGLFDLLRELLKLPASGYGPVQERVTEHLKSRGKALLLLDNAEQIAEGLAPLVETLLAQCPDLQLVVTSRRRLKLEGEQVLKLEPLPQRTSEDLFLARAQATNPRFATTKGGQAQVGAICTLLEGIPLALEIAAARALLVSPAQMHQELATRLRFLVRLRGAEARQLSVRAALEWSYELLSPQARLAFRRSGVFRGGFTLAAARFVFGDEPPALDAIQELIEHSLLKPDYQENGETEEVRYTQLEVVRELAELLLKAIPTDYEDTRAYHADFYLLHARRIGESVKAGSWAIAAEDIKNDRGNLDLLICYVSDRKNVTWLADLLYSLTAPCIEIGYWDISDLILDISTKIFSRHSPERLFINTYKAVLARRRGDELSALQYWNSNLETHLKNNNISNIISTKFELCGQAIDVGELVQSEEIIKSLTALTDHFSLEDNATLKTLVARQNSQKYDSLSFSQEALDYVKAHVAYSNPVWIYCSYYLIPIFRKNEKWDDVYYLLRIGLQQSFDLRRSFIFGTLCVESGYFYRARSVPFKAVFAFWLAHRIHSSLASRLTAESENLYLECKELYKDFPEVQGLLAAPPKVTDNFFEDANTLQILIG